jgi:hypothetical protein
VTDDLFATTTALGESMHLRGRAEEALANTIAQGHLRMQQQHAEAERKRHAVVQVWTPFEANAEPAPPPGACHFAALGDTSLSVACLLGVDGTAHIAKPPWIYCVHAG